VGLDDEDGDGDLLAPAVVSEHEAVAMTSTQRKSSVALRCATRRSDRRSITSRAVLANR
jgi:hypothetical protein